MTPLVTAALVCACLAGGVLSLERGLRRSPRSIDDVRMRMYGANAAVGSTSSASLVDSLMRAGAAGVVERRFGVGLRLVGWSPSDLVSRVVVAAALGLFTTVLTVASLMAVGALALSVWWLPVSVAVGLMAAWVMWSDAGSKIERRRREVRQAANDFVQLVAVGLTTDQSVEQAVQFALAVGSSDAFEMIRHDLASANQRGIALWEALDALGRELGIRELSEFGSSIERQGLQGVSISESVASLAASMRAAALDGLEREADRANANLSGPTIGFVVATVVFLAYPLALRVTEAFGG